jgi:hypothetical protein
MKDKVKPKAKMHSLGQDGENVIVASKRKTPSPLAIDTSTTNTRKRLRKSPPSATSLHKTSTPTPTDSTSIVFSLPTPATPQTPSKPTPSATSKLSARKQRTIHDPINISIYALRKQGLDWNEIATQTNTKCNLTGTDAELSGMACYSRFFRNGPLIARERDEEFRKEWYLHMRGPVAVVGGGNEADVDDGEETESGEDEIEAVVLSAVEKARSEFWDKVTAAVNEQLSGRTLTVEEVKVLRRRLEDREE